MNDHIFFQTRTQGRAIAHARIAAHQKHGDNSIEALDAHDPRWLPILAEEFGEVAHELTYDAESSEWDRLTGLRSELYDLATVTSAWIESVETRMREFNEEYEPPRPPAVDISRLI